MLPAGSLVAGEGEGATTVPALTLVYKRMTSIFGIDRHLINN